MLNIKLIKLIIGRVELCMKGWIWLDIDVQSLIFEFVGGLGIFLLGIKFMGDGLQRSRLKDILDNYTSNPFFGYLQE